MRHNSGKMLPVAVELLGNLNVDHPFIPGRRDLVGLVLLHAGKPLFDQQLDPVRHAQLWLAKAKNQRAHFHRDSAVHHQSVAQTVLGLIGLGRFTFQ